MQSLTLLLNKVTKRGAIGYLEQNCNQPYFSNEQLHWSCQLCKAECGACDVRVTRREWT